MFARQRGAFTIPELTPRLDPLRRRGVPAVPAAAFTLPSGARVWLGADDVRGGQVWRTRQDGHQIIIHLGGRMERLRTELEGCGGSLGPALPGEAWMIPGGRAYASEIEGSEIIHYVRLRFPAEDSGPASEAWQHACRHDLQGLGAVRDPFLHQTARLLAAEAARENDDLAAMRRLALDESLARHVCLHYAAARRAAEGLCGRAPLLTALQSRQVLAAIHEQLGGPLSLPQLAALARQTEHHFLIAFRKAFGATPWQYILRERLRDACRRLLFSREDITSIALACGFNSHSHLTRSFRQHLGRTPSAYRAGQR